MDEELDLIFRALSHRTRRALLARLARGGATISELAEPIEMSLPAVSKHLTVLQEAGLISITVEGRVHRCTLTPGPLAEVEKWMEYYRSFWTEKLEQLARFVEDEENDSKES